MKAKTKVMMKHVQWKKIEDIFGGFKSKNKIKNKNKELLI